MIRLRPLTFAAAALAIALPALPAETAGAPGTVEIAVVANRIAAGEVITEADLEIQAVDARRARGALTLAEIAGLEARRPLTPGTPVRSHDVQQPKLIKKGQAVTMVVSHGGLTIAARGKALEDGGKGDIVRVQNIASQKIIQGEVTASGIVSVASGGLAMLAGL
ncbi:flagellar basal body P-ring formation chaperone FlgA [Pedomonas sp. V897]|uniref:flagellar basal body P-ring formation chaperone FlgA n=1 Tax=Pedomonas sp. V897 TaxID=3446482 RepID=UPI003EE31D7C